MKNVGCGRLLITMMFLIYFRLHLNLCCDRLKNNDKFLLCFALNFRIQQKLQEGKFCVPKTVICHYSNYFPPSKCAPEFKLIV